MTTGGAPVDTYCPINGQFTFSYTRQMSGLGDNSAGEFCARKSSILTNCPGNNVMIHSS